MRPVLTLAPVLMLIAWPAAGQDVLRQIERFVEDLTRPASPTSQPPEPSASPTPPPNPRPRPEGLDDADDEVEEDAPEIVPTDDEDTPIPAPAIEEDAPEVEEATDEEAEGVLPPPQPDRIYQTACPAVLRGLVEAEAQPPIEEEACGLVSPLLVTGVLANGRMLRLSTPATLNCQMATALADWAAGLDGYVDATQDSPLATIETGTSYLCRPRNGVEGAAMSEHGFANALDVTALVLEDGTRISVLDDWEPAGSSSGRLLRQSHGVACGVFTTVLGPEANAQHADHFHFDLGCHGASCTARICQ